MRVLYAALKYDYGDARRGHSFEHYNFYESLIRMGVDVLYYDIGSIAADRDRQRANELLRQVVRSEQPDVLFAVMFRDELDKDVVAEISRNSDTTTIAWFSDDHWRFDSYSKFWAPQFNWAVTTSVGALARYAALGQSNVIKSQWACNPFIYKPLEVPKRYDVSFVGLPHGNRRQVIQALSDARTPVHTFGKGWDAGRVTQDQMVRIFNESCINLNLPNASVSTTLAGRVLAVLLHRLGDSTLPRRLRATGLQTLVRMQSRLNAERKHVYVEQIKGRNFEVPGCGAFLLTGPSENLEQYYVPDAEIACFSGTQNLVARIREFLADPERRESIAKAGYARTLREHTWAHRLAEIFARAGLPSASPSDVLAGSVGMGTTQEIG